MPALAVILQAQRLACVPIVPEWFWVAMTVLIGVLTVSVAFIAMTKFGKSQ